MNFKIGDIVARKSYNYDIMFKIIKINNESNVDLVGVTSRVIADAPLYDLKLISKNEYETRMHNVENTRKNRLDRLYNSLNNNRRKNGYINREEYKVDMYKKETKYKRPGRVLHLDGDEEYATNCKDIYKKYGIDAYVYYVPETEQYKQVYSLLQRIKPDILILTGHDAFSRKRNDIYNIDNYKYSKYYVQAIIEARRYEHNLDNLVIYAGACQSYYEALITAGANFASAPKRVLIDMMDPIVVAENVAYTSVKDYVPIENVIYNTREGIAGIGGIQTKGVYREGIPGI